MHKPEAVNHGDTTGRKVHGIRCMVYRSMRPSTTNVSEFAITKN